ncbi:MAG TPA: SH3 domain-containing protein [Verrucomicrobiae bacterium]|jgi:uncharacterized protein YgiM (DUF1202 family)
MKTNYFLLLGVLVAVSATAQNSSLPPIPPPANTTSAAVPMVADPVPVAASTNAPAKKTPAKHKKKTAKTEPKKVAARTESTPAKKMVFSESTITLVPGPAEVCVSNLNVRGQAGLKGEVVAHVQKGETVTILSQINLDKHKADEPAQWAKITLPTGADVWVRTSFIDAKDKTVIPKKLNLRGGPSEDYSVLGVVEHGTAVTETGTKGEWTKIAAPANAYGFIAAMYLKQEASGNSPTNFGPSTEVPVTPNATEPANPVPTTVTTVTEPPIATPPAEPTPASTALLPPPIANDTNTPVVNPNVPTPVITMPAIDTNVPPIPRVVTHEGYVRSSTSVVAPTYFELFDPATDQSINYLYSPTTNLNLSHYVGRHINVTGEEGLDSRWKDTPVLTVQKIYVLSTNMLKTKVLKSPRASDTH